MGFWLPWGVVAMLAVVVLWFFGAGVLDGSVSADNITLWLAAFVIIAVILLGGLRLRAAGRTGLAALLCWLLALPALLYAFALVTAIVSGSRWN